MGRFAVIVGSAPGLEFDGPGIASGADVVDAGDFVVLYRHGRDRQTPANLVDHHSNLQALLDAGVTHALALSSVGSLRRDWGVGSLVVPDDIYAPGVNPTFFTTTAGHLAPSFPSEWRSEVVSQLGHAGLEVRDGGVYAQTAGPRFESPAEVRALGTFADLVGMTAASECILCGEIDIAYAVLCSIDNLGNGLALRRIDIEQIGEAATANSQRLRRGLDQAIPQLVKIAAEA